MSSLRANLMTSAKLPHTLKSESGIMGKLRSFAQSTYLGSALKLGVPIIGTAFTAAACGDHHALPEPVFDVDAGRAIGDGGGNVRVDGGRLLDSGLLIHDASHLDSSIRDAGIPNLDASIPHDAATALDSGIPDASRPDGCVEWVRTYNSGDYNSFSSMYAIKRVGESNDFIVAGGNNCGLTKPLLLSIDNNGYQNWTRAYTNPEGLAAEALTVDINSDREITFAGNILGKTDPGGNLYWTRSYVLQGLSVRFLENRILIGGRQNSGIGTYIETDSFGNETRRVDYNSIETYNDVIFVHESSEEGSFVVGNTSPKFIHGNNYGYFWLIKYDSQGNEVLRKSFGQSEAFDYRANSAQLVSDGLVIVVNKGFILSPTNSIWLYKIDFQGNIIWNREFNDEDRTEYASYSVKQKISGGFIISGTAGPADSGNGGLIIETDDQGYFLSRRIFYLGSDSSWVQAFSVEETTESDNTNGLMVVGRYFSDQINTSNPCDHGQRSFIKKFCPAP